MSSILAPTPSALDWKEIDVELATEGFVLQLNKSGYQKQVPTTHAIVETGRRILQLGHRKDLNPEGVVPDDALEGSVQWDLAKHTVEEVLIYPGKCPTERGQEVLKQIQVMATAVFGGQPKPEFEGINEALPALTKV